MIVRKVKEIIKFLVNLGAEGDDSLNNLRKRLINVSFLCISGFALLLFLVRLARGEYHLAIANAILLLILGILLLLSYKKHHQVALLLLLHYLLLVIFLVHAKDLHVSVNIFLSLMPCIAVLIIKNKSVKLYYLILCFFLYNYLYAGDWSNIVNYIAITLCSYMFCTLFSNTLEHVYEKLLSANIEKDRVLKKLNEKNEDLVIYNNIMGHDLKAPIRNIQAFTQILLKRNDDPSKTEFLEIILGSSQAMSALVEDILTYSKINQTNMEKEMVDLNKIIEEQMVHFSYEIKNNNAILERSPLPKVWGDGKSLKTIFHNLISNGFKYQPQGKPNHKPTVRIYAIEQEAKVIIYVEDNGIGIEEQFVSELFTPFRRFHSATNYAGTGLGMTICKRIMEKHEGQISLERTSENGSSFKLEFNVFNG